MVKRLLVACFVVLVSASSLKTQALSPIFLKDGYLQRDSSKPVHLLEYKDPYRFGIGEGFSLWLNFEVPAQVQNLCTKRDVVQCELWVTLKAKAYRPGRTRTIENLRDASWEYAGNNFITEEQMNFNILGNVPGNTAAGNATLSIKVNKNNINIFTLELPVVIN